MCNFRSGEAVLTGSGLKVYWSKITDSHTAIRKEFGIAEVMDLNHEPGHIPIELIPVRGLLRKRDYDLVFNAGKPSWWLPEYDQQAIDQMWDAVTEWLDVPTRTLRCPSVLRLSGITKLPKGMIVKSVGGNLYLDRLASLEKGVKFPNSVGDDLYLGSLNSLEKGVKFPNSVGGDLRLNSLTSLEAGVALPKSVGGDLYLHRLTSLENVPRKLRDKVRRP